MVEMRTVLTRFLRGFRRTAVFAITTRCNCRCYMCDIYKKPPRSIDLEDAKRVLRFLSENKFLIVYFTGGEPSLHPDIVELVRYADQLGLVTSMTTNGTISRRMIEKLKEAGLFLLSVSVDHWDANVCEKIKGYQGIKAKHEEAVRVSREVGLRVHTLTFLGEHIVKGGVRRMVEYVNLKLGVPFGFCYPIQSGRDA